MIELSQILSSHLSFYQKKIGKEILRVIPYIPELSKLPNLDPITPPPKVPLDEWKRLIRKIAKEVTDDLNVGKNL